MTRRSMLPIPVAAAVLACMVAAMLVAVAPAARAAVFSNNASITFNDPFNGDCVPPNGNGTSSPYPSNISVSGLSGTVSEVTATIRNVSSTFAPEMDILLVAPTGAALVLVSDAGGTNPGTLTNVTVTFDDDAGSQLPDSPPAVSWAPANTTVSSRPVDYDVGADADVYPSVPGGFLSPAPAGAATLDSAFDGIDPNGTWSLYAVDDGCNQGDVGSIAGGWSLDITTAAAAGTTTVLGSSPNPSTTGQLVTFAATVTSGGNPVTTGTVTFREGATTLASNVALNASGVATFSTTTLTEGDHVVTATYNGTAALGQSSDSVDQRVDNATTNPSPGVYCNPGAIAVPSNLAVTPAVPYPSHITVSGFVGVVGEVTAQLRNVSHPHTDDIDVLLVGPDPANNLILASDAPSTVTAAASNVTVTFDDDGAGTLPTNAAWGPSNGSVTVTPTDLDPAGAADTFPAPAPAPSANTTLASAFDGVNPNGQWSLYVVDDGIADAGTIAGGWCLTISAADTTPPTVNVNQAGGQADPTSASPVGFTVTFSEAVTGFTAADISFAGSTAPGTLVANVTGGPTTYNVAVSGMGGSGLVMISVPAGVVTDLAGNPNAPSTAIDDSVLFNTRQSLPGVVTGSVDWKLRGSLTTGPPEVTFAYGAKPLVPITGDWDGNDTRTAGTFEAGVFKLNNANDASPADITFAFGNPRGFPVVGDWNGDGLDDVAVFFAGGWEIRHSGSGTTSSFSFGPALNFPAVVPVAGDWDGDGVDGIGIYNLMGGGPLGEWNLRQTASTGPAALTFVFGSGLHFPVTGDWDADGTDGVGTKLMGGAGWALRNTASAGAAQITFDYGAANDFPVVWRS